MPISLPDLPPEVLDVIASELGLSDLSRISLVCGALHRYVENHGYRTVTKNRYPTVRPSPYWKDAARTLTGLTRCWETRSFIARYIDPPRDAQIITPPQRELSETQRRRGYAQTIGYLAVVGSLEEMTGNDWRSRQESVAMGAGADLRVRIRSMGHHIDQMWEEATPQERQRGFDQLRHHHRWYVYQDFHHKDGKCDITTINILPKRYQKDHLEIVCGRACGALERVAITDEPKRGKVFRASGGANAGIRFADLSPGTQPLLAAGSVSDVKIYRSNEESGQAEEPLASIDRGSGNIWTWSGRFLSPSRLVLGGDTIAGKAMGEPLVAYDVRPDTSTSTPLWNFKHADGFTCVTTVCTVPSSESHDNGTNIFLSGWRSGSILAHDLRSPERYVARYSDPIDSSSRYSSLLALGTDRFLAGSSSHGSIKVFDLRLPGSKTHSTISMPPAPVRPFGMADSRDGDLETGNMGTRVLNATLRFNTFPISQESFNIRSRKLTTNDFTIFLRESRKSHFARRANKWVRNQDLRYSSIYHMSSPSPFSPTFYAGARGTTVQFDLVSANLDFPDVSLQPYPPKWPTSMRQSEREAWLDPWRQQVLLGLVEHANPNVLSRQVPSNAQWREDSRKCAAFADRWKYSNNMFFDR